MEECIQQMQADLADIKNALLGNPYNKDGVITRITTLEKKINRIEREKIKVYGMVVGATGIIQLLINLLPLWLK